MKGVTHPHPHHRSFWLSEADTFFSWILFQDPRLKVIQDPTKGRGYAAEAEINPGTTLIQERVFHKHTSPLAKSFLTSLTRV